MIHFLEGFGLGLILAAAMYFLSRKRIVKVGDELHLSIDKFDQELLAAGKVANARISTSKDLAEKSFGDLGLSVFIHNKF